MGRFTAGLKQSSTAELIDLEASGVYTLREGWADTIFYGAVGFVGGIGEPVIQLAGTAPLRNEVFHRPPSDQARSYGATGMTFERMRLKRKPVCYQLPDDDADSPAVVRDGTRAELVLVAAHTRLVRACGRAAWLNAPLEDYWITQMQFIVTVRPLWVSWNHRATNVSG